MNKKILIIGSIFLFIGLTIAPSINANQIEAESEELALNYDITLKIPDKFPLLYYLVLAIGYFKIHRHYILYDIAIEWGEYPGEFNINHPLLLLRSLILIMTANWWFKTWRIVSYILGFNWDIPSLG